MTTSKMSEVGLDKAHERSYKLIQDVIKRMGKDDFIQFYRDANEKINRYRPTTKEVEAMIEGSPKYMALTLTILKKEKDRDDKNVI